MFKIILVLLLTMAWPVCAQAETLRDPTRPLRHSGASAAPIDWELNAVFIGGTRRLAVINGQQLRENDLLPGSSGVRLHAIEPRAVVLQQGTRTWRVRLAGNGVRSGVPTENRAKN